MLDVRKMRLLREVATRGSITAAARALSYTPSAVSQQLAALEREAGVKLVERSGRGIRLTDAASTLVSHTEDVLATLERAEAALAANGGATTGSLRVAAFPTAAASILPAACRAFAARLPKTELTIVELEPEDSLPALKSGALDVAVSYTYDFVPSTPDPGVESELLLVDPLSVALPVGHWLATRGSIRLAELRDERFGGGHPSGLCYRALTRACHAAGFEPLAGFRSNDFQVILALVGAGLGVALVPGLAPLFPDPRVVLRPLAEPALVRNVWSVTRRGSSSHPVHAAMLEAIAEAARTRAAGTPGSGVTRGRRIRAGA